jgi:Kef-type K+ transport system membrane component KefB
MCVPLRGCDKYQADIFRRVSLINTLLIIGAMVLIPWLILKLLKLESWIPLPMFQILTGLIVGPSAVGALYPELFAGIFTQPVRASLDTIQTLAIVIFAFIAGLELKPREVVAHEGNTIWVKALQVVLVPILLAAGSFALFFQDPVWHNLDDNPWKFIWAMGVATCITALPMLVIASKNLGIYGTDLYRRLLLLVTFDDLILWLTVALIVALGQTMLLSTLFLTATAVLYWLWPKLLDRCGSTAWPTLTVALVLAMAAFSHWAGLHYLLGAFFAGMITPKKAAEWNNGMAEQQMFWLMPVFFIWTGLKAQWSVEFSSILAAALIMYVIAVSTKFVGVWLAYKHEGINMVMFKTAVLQNKGLMEIFLATVMLKAEIISSNMFAAVVIMSIISTVSAVPLARLFQNKIPKIT